MLLLAKNSGTDTITLGTGFFVDTNVIATNYHVVKNASLISAKLILQKTTFQISEIIGIDKERDLALLRVEGTKIKALPLGNVGTLRIGDEIYVVGNPEGWEGTFSQGIISGFRVGSYIQITAPISHGSSGGPVLNKRGEVIGVAAGAINEGQNLNFAISSSDFAAFQRNVARENRDRASATDIPRPLRHETVLTATERIICKGDKYYERRFFASAAEQYMAAISIDANLAEAHYRLGNGYVERSRYSDAVAEYKIAIALGDVYEKLPGTQRAIHAYEKVFAFNLGNDIVNFILGEAYLKNGGYEKALKKYRILRALNSSYSNQLLRDIGKYGDPDGPDLSGIEEISDKQKCPR